MSGIEPGKGKVLRPAPAPNQEGEDRQTDRVAETEQEERMIEKNE